MPIKVIVWNIEEFGAFTKLKKGPGAATRINGTLAAIATIVGTYDGDVLVIQEFREAGIIYLERLRVFLEAHTGGNWSFDYMPGAVEEFKVRSDVLSMADLAYTKTANTEGYAAFWRDDDLAPFPVKLSAGRNADAGERGFISPILTGSQPEFQWDEDPEILADGKGYASSARFPTPYCDNVKNAPDEPEVNELILLFSDVRRPCVVNVNTPATAEPVPVIVYHAPAAAPACLYGALACALIDSAGYDKTTPLVLAGDFNLTTKAQFDTLRLEYRLLRLAPGTLRSASGEFGFARTQTQYKQFCSKPPALVAEGDTYEHPRDVLFYRGMQNPLSGVIDVVADLRKDQLLSQNIFGNDDIRDSVIGALDSTDVEYQLKDFVRADAGLLADIRAPFAGTATNFTTSLAATVFYRGFVSDHLPIFITL